MQEMVLLRNLLQLELRNNESSTLSSGSSEVHDSRIISLSFNYIKILYIYRLYGSRMGLLVLHNGSVLSTFKKISKNKKRRGS